MRKGTWAPQWRFGPWQIMAAVLFLVLLVWIYSVIMNSLYRVDCFFLKVQIDEFPNVHGT